MSDKKESYTDYLRRVADDFEEDGMHATAKDYREAAKRVDNLVYRLRIVRSKIRQLADTTGLISRDLGNYE